MEPLPLSVRLRYWQSLIRQELVDPRLYPGTIEELRAALRDALREIPQESQGSGRWRGELVWRC
ncbi:MAG: hypothetical protein M1492_01730 [Gammaproteobacteria bacterium]|jgi:hypothetical protein|nr:hypothetical protein [Gammaproteobacteria bacterium]